MEWEAESPFGERNSQRGAEGRGEGRRSQDRLDGMLSKQVQFSLILLLLKVITSYSEAYLGLSLSIPGPESRHAGISDSTLRTSSRLNPSNLSISTFCPPSPSRPILTEGSSSSIQ